MVEVHRVGWVQGPEHSQAASCARCWRQAPNYKRAQTHRNFQVLNPELGTWNPQPYTTHTQAGYCTIQWTTNLS
jgi:hypothetical protein